MSGEQKYLCGIVIVISIAAVPAFFMNLKASNNVSVKTPSTSKGKDAPHVFNPTSVPETELNLTRTTKERRKELRNSWKVNINTANRKQLMTVPKVGPKTAQKILNYRGKGKKFYRVSDLTNVKGIGSENLEYIEPHVTVGEKYRTMEVPESETEKINVNTASKSELEKLPGIGPSYAERIVDYRDKEGSFGSIDELKNVKGIGPKTVESLREKATTY